MAACKVSTPMGRDLHVWGFGHKEMGPAVFWHWDGSGSFFYQSLSLVMFIFRTASPGRLGQLEAELFRGSKESETELPRVLAVTLALVDGQRQVGRTSPLG